MSTIYEVIVENKSPSAQEFFFFQQPAEYSGGQLVYTNSVGHGSLPAYNAGRTSQLQFTLIQQYYAGVQKQVSPPIIGQVQTGIVSQVAIDLAPEAGKASTKDGTTVVLDDDSLYLTVPVSTAGVQPGAFRIQTPTFVPSQHKINRVRLFQNDNPPGSFHHLQFGAKVVS